MAYLDSLWPMVTVLRASMLALLLLLHVVMVKMLIDVNRGTRYMATVLLDLTRKTEYAPCLALTHKTPPLARMLLRSFASTSRFVSRRGRYWPVEREATRLSALHGNTLSARPLRRSQGQ